MPLKAQLSIKKQRQPSLDVEWYWSRLQRMTPREMLWRVRRIAATSFSRPRAGTGLPEKAPSALQSLAPLQTSWPVYYFTTSYQWQGEKIPWQGETEADLVAMPSDCINYRKTILYGDPKNTWELNRHQFLRLWVNRSATPASERANAVSHLLLNWIENNPWRFGINWCSSLEVALRIMSWQSAVEVLGWTAFSSHVVTIIHKSVREHARHIRQNPSLFSSANNHRIGELTGEVAAAAMFPDDRTLLAAASRAWTLLRKEAQLQVHADGVDREQAFYYHAYVLLYLDKARHYAEMLSFEIPDWYNDKISAMQHALNVVTDIEGCWFEIGDRDDGDLRALQSWTGDPPAISVPAKHGFYKFKDSGYVVWKLGEFHLLFRCGPFGYPSIAAHAHCDQLSVLLKLSDTEILTDSGTCSYHDNTKWRQYFRSTAAHNTVRVNNGEQAEQGGPFLWNSTPAGILDEITEKRTSGETRAWCNGRTGVVHRRTLEVDENQPTFLTVVDQLVPEADLTAQRSYDLIWNFAPGISLAPAIAETDSELARTLYVLAYSLPVLKLRISSDIPIRYTIYNGDESKPAGWYSRRFGQRLPITQLRIKTTASAWTVSSAFTRVVAV